MRCPVKEDACGITLLKMKTEQHVLRESYSETVEAALDIFIEDKSS